jgi:hypothetical protein
MLSVARGGLDGSIPFAFEGGLGNSRSLSEVVRLGAVVKTESEMLLCIVDIVVTSVRFVDEDK